MYLLAPKKDSRNAATDARRWHANYYFAERFKFYIEERGDSCTLTRKREDAPEVSTKSMANNTGPEITFIIDCYNDQNPTTSGFFVKADAYSALVETFVHEMYEYGLRPMTPLGYDTSIPLQYGTTADIELYLGFITNTQLQSDSDLAEKEAEKAQHKAEEEAEHEGRLAVCKEELDAAKEALLKAQEAKRIAEANLREAQEDFDTAPSEQREQAAIKLATAKYAVEVATNNVAECERAVDAAQAAVTEEEAYVYVPPADVVEIKKTDYQYLTDDIFLDNLALRLVEGAYGPPIKTVRDLFDTGNDDPYFYRERTWVETVPENDSHASIEETAIEGARIKFLSLDSGVFNYYPTAVDKDGDGYIDPPPPPSEGDSDIDSYSSDDDSSSSEPQLDPNRKLKHYTWCIHTTYTEQTKCAVLFSVRTRGEVTIYSKLGNTEYTKQLNALDFTVITYDAVVEPGDILEIGVEQRGHADFTGVWVSPIGKVGDFDDPKAGYNMLPSGYRSNVAMQTVKTGTNAFARAVTEADNLLGRAQDKVETQNPWVSEDGTVSEEPSTTQAQAAESSAATSTSSDGRLKDVTSSLAAAGFSQCMSQLLDTMRNDNPLSAAIQDTDKIAESIQGLSTSMLAKAKASQDPAEIAALMKARASFVGVMEGVKTAAARPTVKEALEQADKQVLAAANKKVQAAKDKADALQKQKEKLEALEKRSRESVPEKLDAAAATIKDTAAKTMKSAQDAVAKTQKLRAEEAEFNNNIDNCKGAVEPQYQKGLKVASEYADRMKKQAENIANIGAAAVAKDKQSVDTATGTSLSAAKKAVDNLNKAKDAINATPDSIMSSNAVISTLSKEASQQALETAARAAARKDIVVGDLTKKIGKG